MPKELTGEFTTPKKTQDKPTSTSDARLMLEVLGKICTRTVPRQDSDQVRNRPHGLSQK